ncbi:MAG: prephenate dehydratase [Candidatus Marinimicrobia bacterium]|nr:prephenate dehydratase [Candidatus Neomarinimicrobiota bacterium]MBL7059849.1 prephenate dehydratase [Candidatus Neomarinimicrobiota bacterium]
MTKIGIMGGKGSFSEQAAHVFAENHGIEAYLLEYLISSASVLDAVEKEEVNYGIFAMENAQGGVVIESVEALAKHRCTIVEMFHIPVDQNLLGLQGSHIGDITEIHSHQQALRQCRNYLAEHFWTRPLIETDDTAEAARRLSEGKLEKTAAVIANKACAELYDLAILQDSIHDLKHNLTLFLGVKKL